VTADEMAKVQLRIHLNLIEVGKSNIGQAKKIDNIAGCLISVACKIPFGRDSFGFVSLKPKAQLISLRQDKYGFDPSGSNNKQSSGTSFRMIAYTGDWDAAVGTNGPGQPGKPEIPFYNHLFEPWANDQYFPVYY